MPISTPPYKPEARIQELGDVFYDGVAGADFPKRILRFRNQEWAERIGLGALTDEEWIRHFAAFEPLPGNLPGPLALRYHGHQFRAYNPDLGDGRGFLFAQLRDTDGRLLDLGTKGSGQTPWSRGGDGRLTLKGAVREALATETLEALGVYTSKTFSVIETGEQLVRHDEPSPTRSAVLVRLSHGHIRFGTFQRQAFFGEAGNIRRLLEYSARCYFPELLDPASGASAEDLPARFLREVTARTAALCASWMIAGFVHGVLNTDNMNITGESFDYGPYRFLPVYDPSFTAAYFDHTGLYAYGRQPESVLWNLEQLAACLTLVAPEAALVDALGAFAPAFNEAILGKLLARLGVESLGTDADSELLLGVFRFMEESRVPFEQFFFDWYGGPEARARAMANAEAARYAGPAFEAFTKALAPYRATSGASRGLAHPYFKRSKPCSMLIDEIEWIWQAIDQDDDWSRFNDKIKDVRAMREAYGFNAKKP